MINVYIDPPSRVYLGNALFKEDKKYDRDDILSIWRYLKNYCLGENINLNTIDFWNEDRATAEDIYISFEHKGFLRKVHWRFKDKRYPAIKLNNFKKRILFQFEPPLVMPEVYKNINKLLKIYDKIFLAGKINNHKINYFHYCQAYDRIFLDYWNNSDRKFLTMINSNKKIIDFKKILISVILNGNFSELKYKELLSSRIKAINFFSRTNDIDLYGSGWDKHPPFPYWFFKGAIQKVYKGTAKSKYITLSKYKFSICFENCIFLGYVTEKIFDCFLAGNIPVYLGAPDIQEYVPRECFIDMRNFKDYNELRNFLKSLTDKEINNYKRNARQFLESERFKPFAKEHFAKIFVDACVN